MDRWRSFPLASFAPLARLPGVRLVSLQIGDGVDQLNAADRPFPVIDLPNRTGRDFMETAAILTSLQSSRGLTRAGRGDPKDMPAAKVWTIQRRMATGETLWRARSGDQIERLYDARAQPGCVVEAGIRNSDHRAALGSRGRNRAVFAAGRKITHHSVACSRMNRASRQDRQRRRSPNSGGWPVG